MSKEQASWVCQCEEEVVNQLEMDFKETLAQQVTRRCFDLSKVNLYNFILGSSRGHLLQTQSSRVFGVKFANIRF